MAPSAQCYTTRSNQRCTSLIASYFVAQLSASPPQIFSCKGGEAGEGQSSNRHNSLMDARLSKRAGQGVFTIPAESWLKTHNNAPAQKQNVPILGSSVIFGTTNDDYFPRVYARSTRISSGLPPRSSTKSNVKRATYRGCTYLARGKP